MAQYDVTNGETSTGLDLKNGDTMYVSEGGTANNTTVGYQGNLTIQSGGVANNTTVGHQGNLTIQSGGVANNTTVGGLGYLTIESGGTAYNTTFAMGISPRISDKYINIQSGSTLYNTTVERLSGFTIPNGVTANSITVNSGSSLTVKSGGKLTGQMTFDDNATIDMQSGSILLFDLAAMAPGNNALVNKISLIDGDPTFTIVVSESQEFGTYKLAGDAADYEYYFYDVITVKDTDGKEVGTLSLNQAFQYGETSYKLEIANRNLVLTIGGPDTAAPTFSGIVADVVSSDSAIQGVRLSAEFEDDIAIKDVFYRIGEEGEWSTLKKGVTVTEDTTVYFKAVDCVGKETEVISHTVENIPKKEKKLSYVYLDFDGQSTSYDNRALNLSFAVTVQNSLFSDEQKQVILAGLTKRYKADGVVFMLERPVDESIEYSTLYFGKTDAFDDYGEFFGVAETHDGNNMSASDEAFILLDNSYSTDQVISVAAQNLDHLLGNSCLSSTANTLADYAVKTVMLSTEWNQLSPYNDFCPIDPSTNNRCVTGCTNTAAAQLINYWLEKGMLDFSLSLNQSDSYAKNKITIDESSSNASQFGYKAFSEVNEILATYDPDNQDFISALCFAVGVVQKAKYSFEGTSTPWTSSLFTRSGFDKEIKNYYSTQRDNYLFLDDYQGLTDRGVAVLTNELINGRPVGASLQYSEGRSKGKANHAVVIDGYNSATNEFHLNYGWGRRADYNRWFSLNELNEYGIYQLVFGITPNVSPDMTVSGLSSEADCFNIGDVITLNFTISNQGTEKSAETVAYVYCDETILGSAVLDPISTGFSRSYTYTVNSSDLSPGTHDISIKVNSGKGDSEMSSLSQTIRVYKGGISDADNTWKQARDAGDWTRTTPEYDPDGIVGETLLAELEYVGFYDRTDYREITLEHNGLYTFALSGVENDLEIRLFSLTAEGVLKEEKMCVCSAENGGGALANVPLLLGTYYVSVSAVNGETHGDSSYTLSVAGKGFLHVGNHDDWTDLKTKGVEGEVESVGAITVDSTSLVQGEWVGLGDEFDYRLFTIQSPAMLSFTVTASDAVEFAVYELQEKKDKNGNVSYGIKLLQSKKVKSGDSVNTDGLLLPAGKDHDKYCFYVRSTNAAKGGDADYSVFLNQPGCVFFTDGDNSDDWEDLKSNGKEGAVGNTGTLNNETKAVCSGWIGFGDPVDYMMFTLDSAAKLGFCLDSTDAAKFTVWRINEKTDRNGIKTYSLKSLQTTKLKSNGDSFFADTSKKELFLEAGVYCFSMESTTAKKGGNAYYNVSLLGCEFYSDGNNTDDWNDVKTMGWGGAVADLGIVDGTRLAPDNTVIAGEWIGFGDKVDYKKFTLANAAELDFAFNTAGGFVKFTICKLKETVKIDGTKTYSQVKVKTVTATSKNPVATINSLRLNADDYYFKVESTNVKKGTGYSVQVTKSDFYVDGDDGWNNVLLNGKKLNENENHFCANGLGTGKIYFDRADNDKTSDEHASFTYNEKPYDNFVGFGDEIDFAKITLTKGTSADVTFSLTATGDATLEVFKVTKNGEKYTKKSLQTVKIKIGNAEEITMQAKKPLTLEYMENISYYISVKATNTKKISVDPRVYYNVSYTIDLGEASVLAMPETDSPGISDALSLGGYDAGALADASASSLAGLDDKSAWQSLAYLV